MRRISSVLRPKPIPSLTSASSLIDASRKATSWSTNGRARRRIRSPNPSPRFGQSPAIHYASRFVAEERAAGPRETENVQVSPRVHAGLHGSTIPRGARVHARRPRNRPAWEAGERESGERVRRAGPRLGPFPREPERGEHPGGPRGEPFGATVLPRSGSARLRGAAGGPRGRPDREQGRRSRPVGGGASTLDPRIRRRPPVPKLRLGRRE